MNLGPVLDVAISLIFVYVLAALLASTVNEMVAGVFKLRGVYLTKGIEELTSLGTNNRFGWGGLRPWLCAVCRRKPTVSTAVDQAAVNVMAAAEAAAATVGSTAASVQAAVRGVANFKLLTGLDDTIADTAAAAGATAQTVLNVIRAIGGIANLQSHPLLVGTPSSLPSYVPARDFAAALLGVLKDGSGDPAFQQAKTMIGNLPDGDLKTTLLAFISAGADDIDKLRTRIENWFDDAMERVGGIYKRFSQYVMLVLGLLIAVCMNIDSVHMVKTLWDQPALSRAIADGADQYVKDNKALFGCQEASGATAAVPCQKTDLKPVLDVIDQQNLPIGRKPGAGFFGCPPAPGAACSGPDWYAWTVIGWIVTAFAISLGAQFWFGLLTQLTSLRASGDKPARADATPTS